MNTTFTAIVISACLLAAIWIGRLINRILPQHHLSADTKDTVKLSMGLVATMSALLLGLLVSSAKGNYDTVRGEVLQMAAKTSLLDRVLAAYGPEAAQTRAAFRAAVQEATRQMWPQDHPSSLAPNVRAGDALYAEIQSLPTRDDTQRALKTQAASLAVDLAQLRSLLSAQSVSAVSKPLLVVVVCWLVAIFLSFSLLAPSNATASLALVVSALAVAGAIFLILELDHPFGGLIRITSEPMVNALSELPK